MKKSRRGNVDAFIVMDIMEMAREAEAQGRHVIHLEVGQPSRGAPKGARERLSRDIAEEPLGYTVSLGLPELRARIAQHYAESYDLDLNPNRVVVTAGASGAFILGFSALFDEAARVGMGRPCYPSYRQILRAQGLNPVLLPTDAEAGFQPDPENLKGMDLEGLILASPGNPTGAMIARPELEALTATCAEENCVLISDEIYHGLSYGSRAVSALEVTDECYVINSFSKYFALTGWRVGWMVVPEAHVRPIERLAQNLFICASHAAQKLALYSFDCREELDETVADYAQNRELMLARLPKMGLGRFVQPDGAFYVYVDISHLGQDSLTLARRILDEADVAVAPGIDFDPEDGDQWLRLSYARAPDEVSEGLDRLETFLGSIAG